MLTKVILLFSRFFCFKDLDIVQWRFRIGPPKHKGDKTLINMVERSGTILLSAMDQVKLLLFKRVLTLLIRRDREVMIDIANINTYDKSDNHVLFTLSL